MGGLLPEVTTADELSGTNPKRLSAAVIYHTVEKFW